MREIKFRCWDVENKEMLDVQELDYADSYDGNPMIRTTMYNDYFDTEEMILMQYTGLKDKNGKEIYEGDIVEITRQCIYEKGQIIFKNGCFFIKSEENLLALYNCELNNYQLKVIGNIWED